MNIFGGIVNCATVATGIIEACNVTQINLPVVVRLEGNISILMSTLALFIQSSDNDEISSCIYY